MEYENDRDTNYIWYARYSHQRTGTGTGGRAEIIEIDQNTEKSPEDLKRRAVTQTPVKIYQLTLVWKSLKSNYKTFKKQLQKK